MSRFDWLEFDTRRSRAGHGPAVPGEAPNDGPTYAAAARRLREAGHFSSAARLYRKALGFDEHDHRMWVYLIDSLVRSGELGEADAESQRAIAAFGQVRAFYAARALTLAYSKRLGEAWTHSDISLEGQEASWYERTVRAELLLRDKPKQPKKALDLIDEAADMTPVSWEVFCLGGLAFLHGGLPTFAASLFAEAGHFRPRAPLCWIGLGEAMAALRLFDQAVFYYDRALELEPTHEAALRGRADARNGVYGLLQPLEALIDLRKRWAKRLGRELPEMPLDD